MLHVADIQYVFLVGGLSESFILQSELRQLCSGHSIQVIIPQEASLAVVKGEDMDSTNNRFD